MFLHGFYSFVVHTGTLRQTGQRQQLSPANVCRYLNIEGQRSSADIYMFTSACRSVSLNINEC